MNKKLTLILPILTIVILAGCGSGKDPGNQLPAGSESAEPQVPDVAPAEQSGLETQYAVVDTGQVGCYDATSRIDCPPEGSPFHGQDAQYDFIPFSYTDHADGAITDNNTGLMWQRSSDLNDDGAINISDKKTQSDAFRYCSDLDLAGFNDWRLPDIKSLYSLMNFAGTDPIGSSDANASPFISTKYFDFGFGDISAGERQIDAQWATTTIYSAKVFINQEAMFGLNLADGRIKGYPTSGKTFYVRCVRGNEAYGKNNFTDNGDGTLTDQATGLMWQQEDSQDAVIWEAALTACEDSTLAGHDDWRLPNAKELHSIVDYTRSPDATGSAAIDPLFAATRLVNEAGQEDWGFYWTSTTHAKSDGSGSGAVYIAFGRALGYMADRVDGGSGQWMDVHGAGAQRSDPKTPYDVSQLPQDAGSPYTVVDGALAHGPQGDVIRGANFYRCVRGSSGTFNGGIPEKSDASTDFIFADGASADSPTPNPDGMQPPQDAVDACAGLREKEVCNFTAPGQPITGTCLRIQGLLACVPPQ